MFIGNMIVVQQQDPPETRAESISNKSDVAGDRQGAEGNHLLRRSLRLGLLRRVVTDLVIKPFVTDASGLDMDRHLRTLWK
jgi:hypothetical protein